MLWLGNSSLQAFAHPCPLCPSRTDFDWVWDDLNKSTATLLTCDNRKVNFHMEYSCGTAAIRGNKELADGQHFWEIKMTSPVYGTDMVCGARLLTGVQKSPLCAEQGSRLPPAAHLGVLT